MRGLSITAIGLRTIEECIKIWQTLQKPMQLEFLELAIGSPCPVDFDYRSIPLILHNSCLYQNNVCQRLDLLNPITWLVYTDFIANHNVLALSLHPPLKQHCTKKELKTALLRLEATLKVPVYLEIMPSAKYWCSSLETLVDFPLLLDISHINLWNKGNSSSTQKTCLLLLDSSSIGAIHLSHNRGLADTHDLIPNNIWFMDLIDKWSSNLYVTFESLPIKYSAYERLDKLRLKNNKLD